MKCEEANENNDILKNLILVNLRWIYSNEGKITKENNFSTFFLVSNYLSLQKSMKITCFEKNP